MADLPARPSRPAGLHPAILIGVGLAAVLVVTVLSLRGPDTSEQKPASIARTVPQTAEPGPAGQAPSFDVVRVNPSGDTVVAGRAAPGAEVIIRQDGKEIGRARADSRGEWVFLPSEPLPSGARELTLGARLADGREIAGAGSVLLVVPERLAPGTLAGTTLPEAPVAVLSDPTGAPHVLQGAGGKDAVGKLGLNAVEYDDRGQLRFAGTALPGARVRVMIDSHQAGEAVADAKGAWSLIPSKPVTPGAHRLRLDRLGPDGQVAEHTDYPFNRETVTAKEMAEGNVVVRPGNSLWLLARTRYGQGARYTVIYDANRARLTDPAKIYPGQILELPPAAATPAPHAPVRPR
jgi:nucleoid-associated protein YgaU